MVVKAQRCLTFLKSEVKMLSRETKRNSLAHFHSQGLLWVPSIEKPSLSCRSVTLSFGYHFPQPNLASGIWSILTFHLLNE